MAKHIVEKITDDIDGTEGAQTVAFSLRGDSYEIDLSDANAEKLEVALALFITKARPVRQSAPRGRRLSVSGARKVSREESAKIRQWARAHGLSVSERGRIAADIVEKYEAGR